MVSDGHIKPLVDFSAFNKPVNGISERKLKQIQKHILPQDRLPVNGFADWSLAKYNLRLKNTVITTSPVLAINKIQLHTNSIEELFLTAKVDIEYGWHTPDFFVDVLTNGMLPYLRLINAYFTKPFSDNHLIDTVKRYLQLRGLLFDNVINPVIMSVGFTDVPGKIHNKRTLETYTAKGRLIQHSLNSVIQSLYMTRFCVPQVGCWHFNRNALAEELTVTSNAVVKRLTSKHGLIVCEKYKHCSWCWLRKLHKTFDEEVVYSKTNPSAKYTAVTFRYRINYGYVRNIKEPLKELLRKAHDKLFKSAECIYRVINTDLSITALDPSETFVDVLATTIVRNGSDVTRRRLKRYTEKVDTPIYSVVSTEVFEDMSLIEMLAKLAKTPAFGFNNGLFTGLLNLRQFNHYLVNNYPLFKILANKSRTYCLEWYIHNYIELKGVHSISKITE